MRKGYTIYSFYTGSDDNASHFATLHEAAAAARETLEFEDLDEIEIQKHEVTPLTKAAIIRILDSSGGSWARSSVVVKTVRRRSKVK